MLCASLALPPSPSPVKGEGIEEGEALPEIALLGELHFHTGHC
jgi:hypothetical protein